MNISITFLDLTTLSLSAITNVKEEGSYTSFYNDNSNQPYASALTAQVKYWKTV